MTPADFRRASARTRLQERARNMARAVLVEGVSQAEAGRREGLTRAAAHQAAATVLRAYREMVGAPPGWRVITVAVPPEAEEDIRAIVQREYRRAGLSLP